MIRQVQPEELPQVAAIFLQGFKHDFALREPWIVEEFFRLLYDVEPTALLVAHDHKILGYIFSPTDATRIWPRAIKGRYVFRWALGLLQGRIPIGFKQLIHILKDKFNFFRSAKDTYSINSRILSVAVIPCAQGQGIGRALVNAGLTYLENKGVPRVRLEVRPRNHPAYHLYLDLGFQVVGQTQDSKGLWLIMVKDF